MGAGGGAADLRGLVHDQASAQRAAVLIESATGGAGHTRRSLTKALIGIERWLTTLNADADTSSRTLAGKCSAG
jgi:hypothetical protein